MIYFFGSCGCREKATPPPDGGGGGIGDLGVQFGRRWTGSKWEYFNAVESVADGYIIRYRVPKSGVYQFITKGNAQAEAEIYIPPNQSPTTVRFGGSIGLVAGLIVDWIHGGGPGPSPGYYEVFGTSILPQTSA